MRKLIVSDFLSLDGVIQAPGGKDAARASKLLSVCPAKIGGARGTPRRNAGDEA
jgi:hypothetical protein